MVQRQAGVATDANRTVDDRRGSVVSSATVIHCGGRSGRDCDDERPRWWIMDGDSASPMVSVGR